MASFDQHLAHADAIRGRSTAIPAATTATVRDWNAQNDMIMRILYMAMLASLAATYAMGGTGCSSQSPEMLWNKRYIKATKIHDQGQSQLARDYYIKLADEAPDTERQRLAQYALYRLEHDLGHFKTAQKGYRHLLEQDIVDESGAQALYALSEIARQTPPRPSPALKESADVTPVDSNLKPAQNDTLNAEALRLKLDLLERFPDFAPAYRVLQELRRHYRSRAELEQFVQHLMRLEAVHADHDFANVLRFARAGVLVNDLRRPDEAILAYREIVDVAPEHSLADDALWESAQLHRRAQRWDDALKAYDRLVGEHHEASWFIGTYSSEYAADALFAMATIYESELKLTDKAASTYARFLQEFPTHLLADDAAWRRIEIFVALGSPDRAERALRALLDDYPASRYAEQARDLLGDEAAGTPSP